MVDGTIDILAISGSLRRQSHNTVLLKAAARLAPDGIKMNIYTGLEGLPHFNPDLDTDDVSDTVQELRAQLRRADGVLLCTPEYANAVPAALKNALEWTVSSGEFVGKPVAVISASPSPMGGDKAHDSLLLTLRMLTALIPDEGTMMIPFVTLKLNAAGEITDPGTEQQLRTLLASLQKAVTVSNALPTDIDQRIDDKTDGQDG